MRSCWTFFVLEILDYEFLIWFDWKIARLDCWISVWESVNFWGHWLDKKWSLWREKIGPRFPQEWWTMINEILKIFIAMNQKALYNISLNCPVWYPMNQIIIPLKNCVKQNGFFIGLGPIIFDFSYVWENLTDISNWENLVLLVILIRSNVKFWIEKLGKQICKILPLTLRY
jgi:hypothetical protein